MTCLGFGGWGTPGSGSWVGRVILVLRTFPELVWRSVQNLAEIGSAVTVFLYLLPSIYISIKRLFVPIVMGAGQKFLTRVGSIFCCSGRVSHLWFEFELGKFYLKMSNFQFFPFGSKKVSLDGVKKYPGQRRSGPISNLCTYLCPTFTCELPDQSLHQILYRPPQQLWESS